MSLPNTPPAKQRIYLIYENEKKGRIKASALQLSTLIGQLIEYEPLLWTEKDYEDNRPKITRDNKLIFIGNSNMMKEFLGGLNNKDIYFSKINMEYGWSGHIAIINVKNRYLNKSEVKEIRAMGLEQAKVNEDEEQNLKKLNIIKKADNYMANLDHRIQLIAGLAAPYVWPAFLYYFIAGEVNSNRIKRTQYSLLIKHFFKESFGKFVKT